MTTAEAQKICNEVRVTPNFSVVQYPDSENPTSVNLRYECSRHPNGPIITTVYSHSQWLQFRSTWQNTCALCKAGL